MQELRSGYEGNPSGGGNYYTRTPAPPSGVDPTMASLAKQMMEEKLRMMRDASRGPLMPGPGVGGMRVGGNRIEAVNRGESAAAAMSGGLGSTQDTTEQRIQKAALADMLARNQARSAPPPLQRIGGAGIIPGLTMNTDAMNAYQREAYLPNNAQMVPDYGEGS